MRALRVLKEVDLILCEDTRVTQKLLGNYGISTPTMSYHAQSKLSKTEKICELLSEGKNLALVSDAGTPGISDPGIALVSEIRKRLPEVRVVAVPGASALTAFLSVSGAPTNEFIFLGFLPHKKGRETLFREMTESKRATVFYESPHRIIKTLESLQKFCPGKKVTLGRELTKVFEQVMSGTATEMLQYFTQNPDKLRGEFVVVVS